MAFHKNASIARQSSFWCGLSIWKGRQKTTEKQKWQYQDTNRTGTRGWGINLKDYVKSARFNTYLKCQDLAPTKESRELSSVWIVLVTMYVYMLTYC